MDILERRVNIGCLQEVRHGAKEPKYMDHCERRPSRGGE